MKNQTFKKSFSFLDADGKRARIDAEITDRSNYLEFTASGTYQGGGGQVLDEIKPANDAQKQFIDLWYNWHLNGMSAGTEEQSAAIKKWEAAGNKYDYDAAVNYLKSINLYEVKHPKTGEPYKYGHGWIIKDLPDGFLDNLIFIINNIEAEEKEKEAKAAGLSGDDKILAIMEEEGINEDMLDACKAYLDNIAREDLSYFNEAYQGEYSSDEEFAREMAESLGDIDENVRWPHNCIDWERAACELMQDYFKAGGYYFRNL